MSQINSENLYALFTTRFPDDRSRSFIETADGGRWSYAELATETARYARFLHELGVRKGDRVAVQTDKSPQVLFLYLACLRGGFVYLPLNTAYQSGEMDFFIADAEPKVVVCRPQAYDTLSGLATKHDVSQLFTLDGQGRGTWIDNSQDSKADFPVVSCDGDDTAAILYTSGTTGRPKGAMLSHKNLAANGLALHQAWGWQPGDVLLHALPVFHVHGLFVATHCVLLNGSKMLFLEKFDAASVTQKLTEATVFMGVPTYYTRLLNHPKFSRDSCRGMRLFISGSAPLLEQTFNEFRARTGHTILERYGMTETGMNVSNPLRGERLAGTVGKPLPGVAVRIVNDDGHDVDPGEVGQLLVKGDNVFNGYWRLPEKSAEEFSNGYFKTGDLASTDANGYIAIVGRGKDLIISGGLNVYPKEVERVIDDLDGVVESAVIGLPDPDFGEAVTAVVVAQPNGNGMTPELIMSKLRAALANFKVPKRVFIVDELPRNAMGKVQKNILRERYRREAQPS